MSRLLRVAVLIESSRALGRGMIEGIASYSRLHGPWSMYFEPQGLGVAPPKWLATWDGDGILARIDDQVMADAVLATGLPAIDLRGRLPELQLPFIGGDNEAITRLAFEHLRDRGLSKFAFCGVPAGQMRTLDLRRKHFEQHVESAGFPCDTYTGETAGKAKRNKKLSVQSSANGTPGIPAADFGTRSWEEEQTDLARWVESLPKPVGIMACHDPRGYQLVDACRRASVQVPDHVAIVAVDNDPVLCLMANPPMTSIDTDGVRIGYEAASRLHHMMIGEKASTSPLLLEPKKLVARRSSDMLAIDDPDIAKAVRFIRDHACDGIRVDSVVRHVAMSRSVFERRFKRILGRTPKAELLRIQIDRSRQLLAETDLGLAAIADQTGFSNEKYFSAAFFRQTRQRPTDFRRDARPSAR
jgi:LacI family transcriptional regulator